MTDKVIASNPDTQKLLRQLREIWKEIKRETMAKGGTYEAFIRANTGWTHDEFVEWSANGKVPR